jgi:hypothetical protein
MKIVDATAEHMREFYGYVPRARAWVAIEDDKVVAIAGYKFDNGRVHVFAELNDEIRKHPIKMVRTGRELVAEVRSKGMPILVLADRSVPRSKEFLEHLGFKEQ